MPSTPLAAIAAPLALLAGCTALSESTPPRPPNVLLIVSDDAGYADFGFHGGELFPTPRLDALASEGVQFGQAYVSASVCSPSRAGLLTGRYQQRFGHEHNFSGNSGPEVGLPVGETTLADALGAQGYHSIVLGKWHLGYGPDMHPNARGFDEFYGFLQGSRSFWAIEGNERNRLQRDGVPVVESFEYMTQALADEAAAFVARRADADPDQPWFAYLSFNAVHTPMHALDGDLATIDALPGAHALNPQRRDLAAMTVAMDRSIGTVLDALEAHGVADDTLVVFVNDNGGAWNNASSNAPLRGTKGTPYEGGVRVPMLVRWPGVMPPDTRYELPVSTLDVFATSVAAAGGELLPEPALDGVDLRPFVTGETAERPHEGLFWRRRDNRAVRVLDWKLVSYDAGPVELYDLAHDPREQDDVSARHPSFVAQLEAVYAAWASGLVPPAWKSSASDPRPP